jgi:hypothetical protein
MRKGRLDHRLGLAAMLLAGLVWPSLSVSAEVTLTLDNDFFCGFDRHYTNGIQVAVLSEFASLPQVLRSLHPFGSSVDDQFTFAVGQRIYTPSDKSRSSPDPTDRPYAGWLYALAEFQRRRDEELDHFMVSVGMVGPASFAHQTQDLVHHLIGEGRPHGWRAQIHDEPGLLLAYERAWLRTASGTLAWASTRLHTPRSGPRSAT